MRCSSPSASPLTVPLAPGTTTIALPPSSSTTMCAVPLCAPGGPQPSVPRRSPRARHAAAARSRRRPRRRSSRPCRPHGPPPPPGWRPCRRGPCGTACPVTVSPRRGAVATYATRSMLVLPIPRAGGGVWESRCGGLLPCRGGHASSAVSCASVSKPTASKPPTLVERRFLSGDVQRAGRAPGEPARRPATEPAVAPLESVSQPPETARQMEPVKSPSAWVRAAASSAALGRTWTQWWCP